MIKGVGQICQRCWLWARQVDWRVWGIVLAMAVAVVGTALVYWLGYGRDPATHFGAVFASWVGGVALFVVASAVVAIVSLVRPEQESFDARARILFRRQTGRHIDYIVTRIKEILEHYSEETAVTISVSAFDANERKYRMTVNNKIVVRSYLDDVSTTYESSVQYEEATAPPPASEPNRLVFLRVGGAAVGRSEDFDADGGLERPLATTIDMNGSVVVEYCAQYWVQADHEPVAYSPRRYTQKLTLSIENLINFDHPLHVSLTKDGGTNWDTLHLPHGEARIVLERFDIEPEVPGFSVKVHGP